MNQHEVLNRPTITHRPPPERFTNTSIVIRYRYAVPFTKRWVISNLRKFNIYLNWLGAELQPDRDRTQPDRDRTQPGKTKTQPGRARTRPDKPKAQPDRTAKRHHSCCEVPRFRGFMSECAFCSLWTSSRKCCENQHEQRGYGCEKLKPTPCTTSR